MNMIGGIKMKKKHMWLGVKVVLIGLVIFIVWGMVVAEQASIVEKMGVGKVISANEIPSSWNDSRRTRIVTEKAVIIVSGVHSVIIGAQATIGVKEYNGMEYLCVDDNRCWEIIN